MIHPGPGLTNLRWEENARMAERRALLARDLPALLCVMGGMIGGLILWPLGKILLWGTSGNIADAALPPPYRLCLAAGR